MREIDGTPGAAELAGIWQRARLAPLSFVSALAGRSVKSLLSDATGLSLAHLSSKGLRVASRNREREVERHVHEKARAAFMQAGLSQAEADAVLARRPETAWAVFVFDLEFVTGLPLSLSAACALGLDELAARAIRALEGADVEAYRAVLEAALREDPDNIDAPQPDPGFADLSNAIGAATGWPALVAPTNLLVDYKLLSLLAALDVEWGARYFESMAPTPTLPWLFPRFHPDFDETNSRELKRDVVARPIRSLLQLMWMLPRSRVGQTLAWPDRFPGPSEFARDVARETLTDATVRKMFAGVRRLRLDEVLDLWTALCRALGDGIERPPPWLWVMVGLLMEERFLENVPGGTRPGTIAIPSEAAYRRMWDNHRRRWADSLPPAGVRTWPAWLLAQSSSPPWLRSSQSSGRSSSPRDCQ